MRTPADAWTVVTADGRGSAQFEHTVLVTRDGGEALTVTDDGQARHGIQRDAGT